MMTLGGYWPPSSKVEIADFGVGRIVLRDVFFASFFLAYASIFLAYMEPNLFFCFRVGKFSSAAPSEGTHSSGNRPSQKQAFSLYE